MRVFVYARASKNAREREDGEQERVHVPACVRAAYLVTRRRFFPLGGAPRSRGQLGGRLPSSSFSLLPPPSRGPHRRVFTKTWFDQPWSIRFFPTIRSRSKTKWKGNTRYFVFFFLSFRLRCEKRYWNVVELNGRIVNRQFAG